MGGLKRNEKFRKSDLEVPKDAIFRPHSLRKYFIKTIIKKTGSRKCLDSILCYNIEKYKNDIKDLKEEYNRLLPSLSLTR